MEEVSEILCLPAGTECYGIEFPYVVEICREFRIFPVPCLQKPYCGVANYKGMIIPAAELINGAWEQRKNGTTGCVLVVVRHQKYWLGILTCKEPFILNLLDADRIRSEVTDRHSVYWMEKALYEYGSLLCAVLDLEKTVEGLILQP